MSGAMDAIVRRAEPRDAGAIAEIYAGGFPPEVTELTALGCAGAAHYVEDLIREADVGGEYPFYVTEQRGDVVGFVQLRRRPDTICLNDWFVRKGSQGRALGPRLLAHSILEQRSAPASTFILDVLETNTGVRRWHERSGFQVTQRTVRTAMPLGTALEGPWYAVSGKPQADVVHRHYGFSMLQVYTMRGAYHVGRLGAKWFRLTDASAASDPGLMAALANLDAARGAMFFVAEEELPKLGAQARVLQVVLRMSAPKDALVAYYDGRF